MERLNLCVIGCGAVVADLHLPVMERLEKSGVVRVTALVDNQPVRAERFRRRFREARVFSKAAEALAANPTQLTFIASPAGLHAEHTLAALAVGSHVLVEKPMVTNAADALRLTARAAETGKVIAVGLARRYYSHAAEVAERITRGDLGDAVTFTYREGGAVGWPMASDAVFRRPISGGGVLMDKGVHALDLLDQLFGPATVSSCLDDSLAGGVECNSIVDLTYPGASGRLQLSWDQSLNSGIWIRGSRAEAYVGLDDINHYRWRAPGEPWKGVRAGKSWPADTGPNPRRQIPMNYYECIHLQWVGALRAVLYGEAPAVDAARATRVIATLEKAFSVAQPLDLPWLGQAEAAAARRQHWRAAA